MISVGVYCQPLFFTNFVLQPGEHSQPERFFLVIQDIFHGKDKFSKFKGPSHEFHALMFLVKRFFLT